MDQGVGAAARLPGSDRKDRAVQALVGSEMVSELAIRHGVSRKFVYQQTHKARTVLVRNRNIDPPWMKPVALFTGHWRRGWSFHGVIEPAY